jgi:hypothetical protein
MNSSCPYELFVHRREKCFSKHNNVFILQWRTILAVIVRKFCTAQNIRNEIKWASFLFKSIRFAPKRSPGICCYWGDEPELGKSVIYFNITGIKIYESEYKKWKPLIYQRGAINCFKEMLHTILLNPQLQVAALILHENRKANWHTMQSIISEFKSVIPDDIVVFPNRAFKDDFKLYIKQVMK